MNTVNPEIMCGISSQAENTIANEDDTESTRNTLRVLDLRWSGNNAILRAWSEPRGLPLLQNLQTVNIILPENVDVSDETCTGVFLIRPTRLILDRCRTRRQGSKQESKNSEIN